jgi:hypothetical protein
MLGVPDASKMCDNILANINTLREKFTLKDV